MYIGIRKENDSIFLPVVNYSKNIVISGRFQVWLRGVHYGMYIAI